MLTLFEIQTALSQLWNEFQGLRNREVLETIEYLSEYSIWSFQEIYNMYIDQ